MTFDDIGGLTAGQRAKLEEFRQIGLLVGSLGAAPDISGVTDAQAKSAANWMRSEPKPLLDPTERGIRYVRDFHARVAAKTYDDSVVPGP